MSGNGNRKSAWIQQHLCSVHAAAPGGIANLFFAYISGAHRIPT